MRLHDSLDYRARQAPDMAFAETSDRSISYAEAVREVNRVARVLVAEGLEVGDRAAILSKNSIEMAIFYYACSKAGVAPVPLNYRLAPPEWSYIVNDAQAKLLVAQPELAAALEPVRGELATVKRFLSVNGAAPGYEELAAAAAAESDAPPERHVPPTADLYQMYPREVEDALYEHPAVAEAAVVGVPDEKWGEAVKAVVVIKDGETATEGDILEFCKGRLGGYKRPRSIDFIGELPRNPSGKVLKKDLREPYWAGHDRRVG